MPTVYSYLRFSRPEQSRGDSQRRQLDKSREWADRNSLVREILARLWAKVDQVGFTRFDLGIPPMLVPVRRSDYLLPDGLGIPQREDGTDTLGHYQNGGITAGQVLHFLAAHYAVGQPEKADGVLRAMLERQAQGKFQNHARHTPRQPPPACMCISDCRVWLA